MRLLRALICVSLLWAGTVSAARQGSLNTATECPGSVVRVTVNSRDRYLMSCASCMSERPNQVYLFDTALDRCVQWTPPLPDPSWDSDPALQADVCSVTNVLQALQAIRISNAITQPLARCRAVSLWRNSSVTLDLTYAQTDEVVKQMVACLCSEPYRQYSFAPVIASAQENVLNDNCGLMCRTERRMGGVSTLVAACTGQDLVPTAVTAEAARVVCQASRYAWSEARRAGANRAMTLADARVGIFDCMRTIRSVHDSWNIQTLTYDRAMQLARALQRDGVVRTCQPYAPPGDNYDTPVQKRQEVRFDLAASFSVVHSACTANVNLDLENSYAAGDQDSTDGSIDPLLIEEVTPQMMITGLTRYANVTYTVRRSVHFSCAGNPRLTCLSRIDPRAPWGYGIQLQEKLAEVRYTQKIPSLAQQNITNVPGLFRVEKATESSLPTFIDSPVVLNPQADDEGYVEIAPDDITVRFSAADVNRRLCAAFPRVNGTVRYFQTPPEPLANECGTPWVRRRAVVYPVNVTDAPFFSQEYLFPAESYRHAIDLEVEVESPTPATMGTGPDMLKGGGNVVYPTRGLNRIHVAPRTYLVARDSVAGDRANVTLEIVGRRLEHLNLTMPQDYCFRHMHQYLTVNAESTCGAWRHEVLMQLPGVLEVPISHALDFVGFTLPSQVTLSRSMRRNDEAAVAQYIGGMVANRNAWLPLMQTQYRDPRTAQIRVDAVLQTPVQVEYSANRSVARVQVVFCVPDCPLECISRSHSMRVSGGSTAGASAYFAALPVRSQKHKRSLLEALGESADAADQVLLKIVSDPKKMKDDKAWATIAAEDDPEPMKSLDLDRRDKMSVRELSEIIAAGHAKCLEPGADLSKVAAALHDTNRSLHLHFCSYVPLDAVKDVKFDVVDIVALTYALSDSVFSPVEKTNFLRHFYDLLHGELSRGRLITYEDSKAIGPFQLPGSWSAYAMRNNTILFDLNFYSPGNPADYSKIPGATWLTQTQCDVEVDTTSPDQVHITLPYILHPKQRALGESGWVEYVRDLPPSEWFHPLQLVPDLLAVAKLFSASCMGANSEMFRVLVDNVSDTHGII